jgi:hypothetical protein
MSSNGKWIQFWEAFPRRNQFHFFRRGSEESSKILIAVGPISDFFSIEQFFCGIASMNAFRTLLRSREYPDRLFLCGVIERCQNVVGKNATCPPWHSNICDDPKFAAICMDSCNFAGSKIIPLCFEGLASPSPMRQAYRFDGSDDIRQDWQTSLNYLHRMGCDFFIGISLREIGFAIRCLRSHHVDVSFLIDALRAKERTPPSECESWKWARVTTSIPAVFLIDGALTVQVARKRRISLVEASSQNFVSTFLVRKIDRKQAGETRFSSLFVGARSVRDLASWKWSNNWTISVFPRK